MASFPRVSYPPPLDLALNGLGGYPKVGRGLLDAAVRVIAKVGKECHDRFYIIKALNLLVGDFFIKHLLFFEGFISLVRDQHQCLINHRPARHQRPPRPP